MTSGWETKSVGDVCAIVGGGTPSRSNAAFYGGDIPWATIRDMKADWIEKTEFSITPAAVKSSATNVLPAGTVIVASRVGLGKVCRIRQDTAINQDLRGFVPKSPKQLDPQYLFLWFKSVANQIVAAGTGATVQGVTLPFLRSLQIPIPPLKEQRRIVAVLDEAFTDISRATDNVEKNLANLQDLLDSTFSELFNQGDDWQVRSVSELVQMGVLDRPIDGNHGETHPTKAEFVKSGIPFVMASDLIDETVDLAGCYFITPERARTLRKGFARNGDVLISHKGTIGRVSILSTNHDYVVLTPQVTYYRILQPEKISPDFLYYALQDPKFQGEMKQIAGAGSTRAYIGITAQLALKIRYPAPRRQTEIIDRLKRVFSEGDKLRTTYLAKLAALDRLKSSILHRTFIGELVSVDRAAVNDNWKSPNFAAHIIALAYRHHLALGTEATFGRVKAQKALHLCESVGGIDLGRNPIKDAAGPNDFRHMLAAEEWAKDNQFFEFAPRLSGNGYSFKKLARFNAMVANGAEALQPVKDRLDRAIGLIAPMNSEQAELLATVHAAWNNLVLDGVEATETAIIQEARENWHVAKQKFGDGKFRQAIATIRAKGIEPDGSAKRVGGQEALLF